MAMDHSLFDAGLQGFQALTIEPPGKSIKGAVQMRAVGSAISGTVPLRSRRRAVPDRRGGRVCGRFVQSTNFKVVD
jgi:hypothetical protein